MAYSTKKVSTVGALKMLAEQLKVGIPVKVSDLDNDLGYQTADQVTAAVAAAEHLTRKKVDSLDAVDLSAEDAAQYIYMVPNGAEEGNNKYDEYIVIDGVLEHIGDTAVDLSGYVKEEDLPEIATDEEVAEMLGEVFGTAQL